MEYSDYTFWIGVARRYAPAEPEAEDVVQDALFVAAQQGRLDLTVDENKKWLAGVIRNLSKMKARSASRRKRREEYVARKEEQSVDGEPAEDAFAGEASRAMVLGLLSPAARKVAVLALHGLDRAEICSILNIKDATLRQRIRSIRKSLGELPEDLREEAIGMAYASRKLSEARAREFPLGLLRQALLRHLKSAWENQQGIVGTHDPSGHLIVIRNDS